MKRKEKKRVGLFLISSIAIAAGAVIVMPKILDFISDQYYKPPASSEKDDWGPEIVKRNTEECASEKEDSDGEL